MTKANHFDAVRADLQARPRRWLITGVAGFIGSNLLETLLQLDQAVVGLDNFATGHVRNLDEIRAMVGPERWSRFVFHEGDIRDPQTCDLACRDIEIVLHHAALGSVPRSIADPLATNASNIDGFLNMLVAARDHRVNRFIYAASSSTYGDHPGLPKVEHLIGKPLSPYAVTKYVNELYADVFSRTYQMHCVGLRYFNVFGARQDPNGAYAAVIPRWIQGLLKAESVQINGDGSTSRDFCYVKNVVQANLLSACGEPKAPHEVYNVAAGRRTTLLELLDLIALSLTESTGLDNFPPPVMRDFRTGDVRHSLADIAKIQEHFGYEPSHHVLEGLKEALPWYIGQASSKS